MITELTAPKLRFARELPDQAAFEAQSRGYLSHVMVELDEGRLYPVFFYDVVRLQQDLDESAMHGRPFIADPGMIVVEEITPEAMKHAVEQLSREGFFDHLTAITQDDLASGDPYQWRPRPHLKGAPKKRKSPGEGSRGKGVSTH